MNVTMTTTEAQNRAREIIESAIAEAPETCACGRPMIIGSHGPDVWIECESLESKRGLRLTIASGFHDWRTISLSEVLGVAA
jgi:hypothetical protein